jgi:K+-transporting ATPase ATPase B chain
MNSKTIIESKILFPALIKAFTKLDPRSQVENPVIFLTYLCSIITTVYAFQASVTHLHQSFVTQIAIWLWFTVLFANFAEALAESRGKAQADALKRTKVSTVAKKIVDNQEISVLASELRLGDLVVCRAGDLIPSDGEVVTGIATVDESAITGESAPVIRESGGDRSAVTGGTKVISDEIIIKITSEPGNNFIDKMIKLVEGAKRQKTPNEVALNIVLFALTIIFLLVVITLKAFTNYSESISGQDLSDIVTIPVLIALFVCLIPTTIGALVSAIGISGMDRLIKRNVIAMSGRAVEAAGDIDILLLDKTGTITLGNRMASELISAPGIDSLRLAKAAQLASLADETPEGRSIVVLVKKEFNLKAEEFSPDNISFIPFSANTRMSGVDITRDEGLVKLRKGAVDAVKLYIENQNASFPQAVIEVAETISKSGGTPLVVAEGNEVLGVVHLKDVVKGGIKQRFAELRKMGIKTIMITGDNPLTAAAIAAEAGVDDFIALATPEMKLKRIREDQSKGHLVAMTGDGTNDAPALAQADVGVAMNTGTQAAREAGNMVDLDSNPTKIIEIVEVGKQLLMTRGALTTFSIANDVAKYFAILPAIFATLYSQSPAVKGPLEILNLMHLYSPQTAILSSVIFNALIIISLIPLALRGVPYKALPAKELLQKNILIYGVGGLIAPFVGIKLIDLLITQIGLIS